MRPSVLVLVIAVALIGGVVALVELTGQGLRLDPGSVGVFPRTEELTAVRGADCFGLETAEERCLVEYAFAPDARVTVWISVWNNGPLALTLDGVSQSWLERHSGSITLGVPIRDIDGGNPIPAIETLGDMDFSPVVLQPGDQRLIGIEFHTTTLAVACEHWAGASGVAWGEIPIEWHWLLVRHEQNAALDWPIAFTAPTAAECEA